MNDPRQELFERLEGTLAALQVMFAGVAREHAGAVLTAEEEERIMRQLRALRDEVQALGQALKDPPPDASPPPSDPDPV